MTIKNKFLVLNDTDIAIEIKQAGTPDPTSGAYGQGRRFARALPPGARCAWHWDNAFIPLELVMRPVPASSRGAQCAAAAAAAAAAGATMGCMHLEHVTLG